MFGDSVCNVSLTKTCGCAYNTRWYSGNSVCLMYSICIHTWDIYIYHIFFICIQISGGNLIQHQKSFQHHIFSISLFLNASLCGPPRSCSTRGVSFDRALARRVKNGLQQLRMGQHWQNFCERCHAWMVWKERKDHGGFFDDDLVSLPRRVYNYIFFLKREVFMVNLRACFFASWSKILPEVSLGSWSHGWTSMRPWPLRSTSRGDPPSFFLNRLVATVERPGWCLIRCSVQQSLPQMIPRHLFLHLIFFSGGRCWNFIYLNRQVE